MRVIKFLFGIGLLLVLLLYSFDYVGLLILVIYVILPLVFVALRRWITPPPH